MFSIVTTKHGVETPLPLTAEQSEGRSGLAKKLMDAWPDHYIKIVVTPKSDFTTVKGSVVIGKTWHKGVKLAGVEKSVYLLRRGNLIYAHLDYGEIPRVKVPDSNLWQTSVHPYLDEKMVCVDENDVVYLQEDDVMRADGALHTILGNTLWRFGATDEDITFLRISSEIAPKLLVDAPTYIRKEHPDEIKAAKEWLPNIIRSVQFKWSILQKLIEIVGS
jgi:hypothetical protein